MFTFLKKYMKILIRISTTLLFFLCSLSILAGTYSGGAGTSADPYKIANINDLIELSNTTADWATGKYFIQTAHIDASSTSTLNGGMGFSPIGVLHNEFKGSYDGQNYTISNLFINRPGTSDARIAMFGYVWGTGISIQNLGLINVDITGNSSVAALVGANRDGTITNCYSTGVVKGTSTIGGLVAMNFMGTVSNSYSTCNVSGNGFIGGFVGAEFNLQMQLNSD